MTSKIVVNNIEADSGINTVTFGGDISGNFVGNVNTTGVSTFSGGIVVGSSVTITSGGINATGVITATSFKGNGSQLSGLFGTLQNITTLTSGTSYTTPPTTAKIYVECVGAGGGGGTPNVISRPAPLGGNYPIVAGGGGGGGYCAKYFTVTPDTSYSYAIGAGGGVPTGIGGNTTFGPVDGTTITAFGGGGGGRAAPLTVPTIPGVANAGAGGTSFAGDINASAFPGFRGGPAIGNIGPAGGGGSIFSGTGPTSIGGGGDATDAGGNGLIRIWEFS